MTEENSGIHGEKGLQAGKDIITLQIQFIFIFYNRKVKRSIKIIVQPGFAFRKFIPELPLFWQNCNQEHNGAGKQNDLQEKILVHIGILFDPGHEVCLIAANIGIIGLNLHELINYDEIWFLWPCCSSC